MANNFNLNNFLNEYKTYGNRQYTHVENGKAAMEQREIEQAEKAVQEHSLLSITLSKKLTDMGVGKRVIQEIGDTAVNTVKKIVVDPLDDYFKKYEKVFDEKVYNSEIQSYGKQMFFASLAMKEDAEEDSSGQNFVYDM